MTSVEHSTVLIWSPELLRYDFGPGHPLAPVRVALTIQLAEAIGVLTSVRLTPVPEPDDALAAAIHTVEYIAAVRAERPNLRYGLGTGDVPVFPGMHDAAARIVTASVEAARAVWTGDCRHAVNIAGGLHHAMPNAASGFCVYNDPAAAIRWLLDHGAERVAYVDIDVHHGDGVQAMFYDDPRVLTISLHQDGRTLFPGTGAPAESGGPHARGYAVNVALPPGTDDAGWLRAFHAVVPPLLRAFRPDVLVSQHGCDTHRLDPLAQLNLTVDGQRTAHAAIHRLAHMFANGRWVATGGGGYVLARVVPRSWTHLIAEAAGAPIPPETPTPESWRTAARAVEPSPPQTMTDGAEPAWREVADGLDPADPVDRAILATMREVFPYHGLFVPNNVKN